MIDSEEDKYLFVTIATAAFVGTCLRCKQPTTGSYDSDYDAYLRMECVNCGFKQHLLMDDGDNGLELLLTSSG
jgi:DNA-directed RNA polymerase subunit RPC12/RpoP